MPRKETIEKARKDARQGKSPSTQAGEFVHEEIGKIREGEHGARSSANHEHGVAREPLTPGERRRAPSQRREPLGRRAQGSANQRPVGPRRGSRRRGGPAPDGGDAERGRLKDGSIRPPAICIALAAAPHVASGRKNKEAAIPQKLE